MPLLSKGYFMSTVEKKKKAKKKGAWHFLTKCQGANLVARIVPSLVGDMLQGENT